MKVYRHTIVARFYNSIISRLLRLGLPIGPMALLTVAGRKTGLPRSTPVALARDNGGWILIAAYGPVDWVKNLQASGAARITVRGHRIEVTSHQLPSEEAAVRLREGIASAGRMTMRAVGPYFDAKPNSPAEEWQREAKFHSVFRLTRMNEADPAAHIPAD